MAGSMSAEMASGWRDHVVSAEAAVSIVRPGDRVFVGSACATPRSLVEALERLVRPGVVLVHFLTDYVGTGVLTVPGLKALREIHAGRSPQPPIHRWSGRKLTALHHGRASIAMPASGWFC